MKGRRQKRNVNRNQMHEDMIRQDETKFKGLIIKEYKNRMNELWWFIRFGERVKVY